jgi:ABC-type bacteriocin/lantibiotic exporter with double-glycine peptidase domain
MSLSLRRLILDSLEVLSKQTRKKVLISAVAQLLLSLLDLVAVGLVGALTALSINGVKSTSSSGKISQILNMLQLDRFSVQLQVGILGVLASSILISKTLLSMSFSKRSLRLLSYSSASISMEMVRRIMNKSVSQIEKIPSQQLITSLTTGVTAITVGIIGTTISLVADISVTLLMFMALLLVDPLTATMSAGIFGITGVILYKLLHVRVRKIAHENIELSIVQNSDLISALEGFRELLVRNRREYFLDNLDSHRAKFAENEAKLNFLPSISKYVIEILIVFSSIVLAAIEFLVNDATRAISTLAIFLIAGARIAPAVLRIQQNFLSLRNSQGVATNTLELIESTNQDSPLFSVPFRDSEVRTPFNPSVNLVNVNFRYEESSSDTLSDINLSIAPGEFVAFVGPSAAGKSTLADLILGAIVEHSGTIEISGVPPREAVSTWPGKIGYVPQKTFICQGSILDNITLGFASSEIDSIAVQKSIESSALFQDAPNLNLMTSVGERGTNLSGGQRQRLGIARALYTAPELLVLDEATSALDGKTENVISNAMLNLRGKTTLIVIAHRLSTIKLADKVVYIDGGKILSSGTFTEVKNSIPNFAEQAELMGL